MRENNKEFVFKQVYTVMITNSKETKWKKATTTIKNEYKISSGFLYSLSTVSSSFSHFSFILILLLFIYVYKNAHTT